MRGYRCLVDIRGTFGSKELEKRDGSTNQKGFNFFVVKKFPTMDFHTVQRPIMKDIAGIQFRLCRKVMVSAQFLISKLGGRFGDYCKVPNLLPRNQRIVSSAPSLGKNFGLTCGFVDKQ